ncbi:MAG: TonB-dependent receptor [Bacteroidota bacterium]
MYSKWPLFILFLCVVGITQAQNSLSGTVLDVAGEPIAGANVILKQKERILQFTTSDEQGKFVINEFELQDSMSLDITHLAYDKKNIPLQAGITDYTIELLPRSYDLPEIAVEVPPVTRSGDTLTFNVDAYIKEGDQTIEQVLKRIPGITVDASGSISYQGLDISKFYVEGLDMMEGRYKIITKNLGVQHIRDIQVIERHQPIRALDSIHRPDNAAINLKLKSNVAITGNIRAELALPINGLLAGHLFGFTKKYQFNLSGSYNSVGENISSDFRRFYGNSFLVDQEVLNLRQAPFPFQVRNTRAYLDNQEFTVGLNYLSKLGEYLQLKLQAHGLTNTINRMGNSETNYFLGNVTSSFLDELNASEQPQKLEGISILEYNGKKVFSKINTELKISRNRSNAENLINSDPTFESLENNSLSLSSNIDFLINSKNKRAYQLKADVRYVEKDYELDILDAFLIVPDADQAFFPELAQLASTQSLELRLYTNFYVKKGYLSGLIEVGPKLSSRSIQSRAMDQFDENLSSLINPAFQNDHTTIRQSLSVDQTWDFEKGKTLVKLTIPASYNHFTIKNQLNENEQTQNFLAYHPKLNISHEVFKKSKISFNTSYFNDFISNGDLFYDGLIVQSNRSIRNQPNQPNRYRGQQTSLSLGGLNHEQNLYYYAGISYQNQINEQISNNLFDTLGTAGVFNALENRSQRMIADAFVKYSPLGALDFKMTIDYARSDRDQLINSELSNFRTHNISLSPECTFSPDNHVLTFIVKWDRTSIPQIDQVNRQWKIQYNHYWQLADQSALQLEFANFNFSSTQDSYWTHLMNLTYQRNFPNQKLKLHVSVLNLLNEGDFTTYFQGPFYDALTRFRLNPRQVQVGIKKSL